jgi:HSP20 family molecular chaperone IbpA
MYDTEGEVVVAADLPGVNQKDIHPSITGDLLTIRGERPWNPLGEQRGYQRGSVGSARFSARCHCQCRWTAARSRPPTMRAC